MKTLVVGANGQIGRIFCSKAHRAGLPIRAMLRRKNQAPWFRQQGIETVVADLEEDFRGAMSDCDQVVFTAGAGGAGPDKTLLVDLYGAIRTVDYAKALGLRRLIMVSAMRSTVPQDAPDFLRPYAAAKFAADHYLKTSGMPYLILLPGRLTDDPASHRIRTFRDDSISINVSRENVAECLVAALRHDDLCNQQVILLDGDDNIEETFENLSARHRTPDRPAPAAADPKPRGE
jgi:uncharacterized protein YbjT (DUF2867 family)